MSRVKSSYVVLFIVVASVVAALWFIASRFATGDGAPAANANGPAAQKAAQPTQQAGGADTQPAAPAPTAPPAATPQSIKVTISGAVKREDNKPETQAVVVLYKEDRRGADPRVADAQGRFQFDGIPLSAGNKYTLQTKSPAGCGEESFTVSNVVEENQVRRDVVLRPCQAKQDDPNAARDEAARGVGAAQTDDPQTAALKAGFESVKTPLESLRNFSLLLALLAFVCLPLLMAVAYLLFLVASHTRQAAEGIGRVHELAGAEGQLTRELQKIGDREKLNETIEGLPAKLALALKPLFDRLPTQTPPSAPPPPVEEDRTEDDNDAPGRAPRGGVPTRHGRSHMRAAAFTSRQAATELYQNLLHRRGNVTPVYLNIDAGLSQRSRVAPDRKICFKETASGFFVLFRERGDSSVGWVFPNPRSNFTPDHKWVFGRLTPTNFDEQKLNIDPVEVQWEHEDGVWQFSL